MRVLLFILLHTFTYAEQCLSEPQCDQFKISHPMFANIDSKCEITIQNVTNCIIYCAEPCSYPFFAPGIALNYHYKAKSNEDTNIDDGSVKTNCNLLSINLRNLTNL